MQKSNPQKKVRPPQKQELPGEESKMKPRPQYDRENVKGCGKLEGKIAFITGADSGIGRAVAVLFAKEGADVAVVYLSEDKDARETKQAVEKYGRRCELIRGDISQEKFCKSAVEKAIKKFGRIDVLVNNAAVQHEAESIEEITTENLLNTFATNIFAMFWITKAALPHMAKGSAIINTTSVTAYRGSGHLIDYSSTKGAIVTFTRSLSSSLASKGIRVNGVAPGPIWTPLIPASFEADKVTEFGTDVPLKRAGEPAEVAPSFLFLACEDSSYFTGQILHPNGGEIVNG